MKHGWAVLLVLAAVMAPRASRAQASVYGEFSTSKLTNLLGTNYYYGGTGGVLYDGTRIFHRVILAADVQARFVNENGHSLNGVAVGPRFEWPIHHNYAPYAEFLVGFDRFVNNDPYCTCNTTGTTDSAIQINGGIAKQVSSHFDVNAEFGYSQFYAFGGQFNPKTVSIGAIYHFKGRITDGPHAVPYTKPLPGDTTPVPVPSH